MNKLRSFAENRPALRKLTAIFLAFFTVLGTSLLVAPASYAASTISIDDAVFENSTVEDGDRVSMKVSWSIPDTATNPVSITVPFDEGLLGISDRFDMVGPGGVTAGECTVTEEAITCVVDEDFINSNPINVKGEFWFDVRIDLNNEETVEHTFDFGGNSIPVTVERDSSRCDTTCEFPGYTLRKSGSYNSSDDTITWTVRVPAPESGITAGHNITIADDLDTDIFEMVTEHDGEEYPQLWEGQCLYVNSNNAYTPRWHDASSKTNYVWNDDKTEVGFTSRAGDMDSSSRCAKETEGSFYQAVWVVKVKDLGAAGTYENKGSYTIDGSEPASTTGSVTKQSGGGSVVGENEGAFQVTKELTGNAEFDAVADLEFVVKYVAHLPGVDEPVEDEFKVTPGTPAISPVFPEGTRVEISEVSPTDPENVTWANPVFKNAAGETVTEITFSAENGNLGANTAELVLVNDATLKTNTFEVKKTIENPDSVEIPSTNYTLNWTRPASPESGIPDEANGSWTLPSDGTVVNSDDMFAGVDYMLSEQAPAEVEGATWATPKIIVNGQEISANDLVTLGLGDTPVSVEVVNEITKDPATAGGFNLTKTVTGDAAEFVDPDTVYTVNYSYPAGDGFEAGEGQLNVTAGNTASVDNLPVGAEVTLSEATREDVGGATWGDPVFSQTTFTVVADTPAEIQLENPITADPEPATGNFSVVKTVEGDGADLVAADATFDVNYTYEAGDGFEGDSGTLTVKADGTVATSEQLPTGAVLTLSEATPTAVEGATWGDPVFSPETVTIGDGDTVEVSLTNTITKDEVVPTTGNFSVVKTVEGDGADLVAADAAFDVNYTYEAGDGFEGDSGTLTVKADGTVATSEQLPTGAVLTLSEATPTAVEGATWGDPVFSPETVTIGDGDTVEVSLTNTITKDEVVDPTEPTVDPTEPTVDPTEPTEPTVDPTEPTEPTVDPTEPTEPTVDPTEPTVDPTEPTVDPTEPTEPTVDPTEPTVDPTEPTVDPTEPTEPTVDPTEPTVDPTEPTEPTVDPTEPTEPTVDPTEPTVDPTEPTEPTVDPTEPTVDPTDPTVDPTEPTVDPTDPTVDPTEPTVDPTEPTEPTVDPTEPTVDPTEPTVDPTEPTVDPTEPTVDPTEPTVDPTEPTDPTADSTEPTDNSSSKTPDTETTKKPKDGLADTGVSTGMLIAVPTALLLIAAGAMAFTSSRKRHS